MPMSPINLGPLHLETESRVSPKAFIIKIPYTLRNYQLVKNKNNIGNEKNQVYGSLQNIGSSSAEVDRTDQ